MNNSYFHKFQIRIFQYIHSKGLLFNDVKSTNIAVANNDHNQIVFSDFTFCEFYVNALGEPKVREEAKVRKDDFILFGMVLLELSDIYTTMDIIFEEWEEYGMEVSLIIDRSD